MGTYSYDGNLYGFAFGTFRRIIIEVDQLFRQMHNTLYVLHSFCGQSHHEVQLYRSESAGKGNAGSPHQFFFADIFVDNVPQPLGACFRCESQTAFPHALNPIHQFLGKVVHPQRGQGDVDAVFVQIGQQFVQRFFQLAVVAGTQRGQGQFLIAGGIAERTALPDDGFRRFLPKRTVQEACLTETAAPYLIKIRPLQIKH